MDLHQIKPEKVLDTRGLTFPLPITKTEKALRSMEPGMVLEVWCGNSELKLEICRLCKEAWLTYLGYIEDPEGYWRYFIRKEKPTNTNIL